MYDGKAGMYKRDINMFGEDFMQQSRCDSSVMNLSELIVSSNPALKNILNLAASHEKRTEARPLRESKMAFESNLNQSSIVADNSLINYLDEMQQEAR